MIGGASRNSNVCSALGYPATVNTPLQARQVSSAQLPTVHLRSCPCLQDLPACSLHLA